MNLAKHEGKIIAISRCLTAVFSLMTMWLGYQLLQPGPLEAYPVTITCTTYDETIKQSFGGKVSATELVEKPIEYFYDPSRTVPAFADFYEGQISIQPGNCGFLVDYVLVHELSHALDYSFGYQLSEQTRYSVGNLGHAEDVDKGKRELFAFCVEQIVIPELTRELCPESNMEATIETLEAFEILEEVQDTQELFADWHS